MKMSAAGVTDENEIQGPKRPVPGKYHVVVNAVDDTKEKLNATIVEYQVLAGTVPGQEGLTLQDNLWYEKDTGNSGQQHLRFAIATGLLQPDTEADIDLEDAIGRQVIIEVEKRKGKDGKEYTNVAKYGLAIWRINNPEVVDVPRYNPATAPAANSAAPGTTAPATGPVPAPATPATGTPVTGAPATGGPVATGQPAAATDAWGSV